ncbi:phenylpyruvate tautomerase MIF-related protein [Prochlorococcus marinus]|uniref:L-dopachrome isomerase n=1 Tax=Prochlorococcus marinus (strain AS9601) TaxID=146891 RepID=A2BS81_PROMS|nr:phenylpyruvate tautomerase MIF-related protein [Prochlorococcus marinus]ABM70642.1 Macrophage migration inhibitory factor family protein [Prochlorococcus marinus str. AS9601]
MPYINVSTSAKIENKQKLLEEISILISDLTNKSRSFVMAKIDDNCQMYFVDETPSCFLEIKSIGSLNPSEMAKPISDFIYEKIGIPIDRIYISFEDVPASLWAWNGRIFG